MSRRLLLVLLVAMFLIACDGTTGSAIVRFEVAAAGPADAIAGQPLSFDNALGWAVSLERARLYIGAVYLTQLTPPNANADTRCFSDGLYVAEATRALLADALDPTPQPFPDRGRGVAIEARAGEVWLTGGAVDAEVDPTVILDAAGTATKDGMIVPFTASVTIGPNRSIPIQDPALPSANPLCRQRIASGVATDITVSDGGRLLVRLEPRGWFSTVDFSAAVPGSSDGTFIIPDDQSASGKALFSGLRARSGSYSFEWSGP